MAPRLLVPVTLPEASPVSGHLIHSLSGMEVVLLGHYRLPEQTPPDAAREQFLPEAQEELEAIAVDFEDQGISVETKILFGQNLEKAIDQVAAETHCGAFLDPAPSKGIDRLFVPVMDPVATEELVEYIDAILEYTDATITLGHVVARGSSVAEAEALLGDVHDQLTTLGVDPDTIAVEVVEAEMRDTAILDLAEDHDAVVMKEPDPSVAEWILGTLPERIARHIVAPVIVVFRPE